MKLGADNLTYYLLIFSRKKPLEHIMETITKSANNQVKIGYD